MTTARLALSGAAIAVALLTGTAYAVQKKDAYQQHLAAAQSAATGVAKNILNLCTIPDPDQKGPSRRPSMPDSQDQAELKPAKAFDNLYYVGLSNVSAWAIKTTQGIILIDALNRPSDAEDTILPNMRALGLDPAELRYLIITHGHGDHFGAARYLQQHYPIKVLASKADWELMEGPSPFPGAARREAPQRDMIITDGQTLTLGDTTVSLHLTPGHTKGTVSLLIPVKDQGKPHLAALWGGTAFNFSPQLETFEAYASSARELSRIAEDEGVDVLLSNHPFVDRTLPNLAALRSRRADAPNPYVIGAAAVRNFFTVAGECARARAAAL